MTIERKSITTYNTTNHLSFILISNNDAIKLEINDRRFIMLDVSTKYIGNQEYFTQLAKVTNNDICGEAFFWYCKEFVKNLQFNSQNDKPKTQAKNENILLKLNNFYIY